MCLKKFPDEEIIKLIPKDTIINNYNYICIHGKCKYFCRECGGSQICEHNKIKSYCKECKGSQICEHKYTKSIYVKSVKVKEYVNIINKRDNVKNVVKNVNIKNKIIEFYVGRDVKI